MPLLLDRTLGESIMIGDDIRIELIGVRGNRIRLCFHAPAHIRIDRLEVYERKQMEPDHTATRQPKVPDQPDRMQTFTLTITATPEQREYVEGIQKWLQDSLDNKTLIVGGPVDATRSKDKTTSIASDVRRQVLEERAGQPPDATRPEPKGESDATD